MRTIRRLVMAIIAVTIPLVTAVTVAPTATAASSYVCMRTSTTTGEFHNETIGRPSYYSIKSKAMAGSCQARGIHGKAALYIDGDLQRIRVLKYGNILFRIYRDELPDNKQVTITVRIFPTNPNLQDKVTRREITDRTLGWHALDKAKDQIGDPYKWGADGPGSFDCSGLVVYAYRYVGRSLPHYTGSLRYVGRRVSSPSYGDIVWTKGHVSIYAGNGKVVEAARPGTRVRLVSQWQRGAVYIRPY